MKVSKIGEQFNFSNDFYVSVKNKGDSIKFRIANDPVYEGKHFLMTKEGAWDVRLCPRINSDNGEECELCNKYFEIIGAAKKYKDIDKDKYEKLRKKARNYNVSIQFYFPIVNRELEKFQILRTTKGVKDKIDRDYLSGVDVTKVDWVLTNTGSKSPRDLYSITRLDSADTKEFSDKEKEEFKKAQEFDMFSIAEGSQDAQYSEEDVVVDDIDEYFDNLIKESESSKK